jgi:hypothetical protein
MVTTKDGGDAPTLAFEHASTSMCAEETPPKITTRYGNAPTPASEDASTSIKRCRIYSPSKQSTHDFCENQSNDSDSASIESDVEGARVPPAKRRKRASHSRNEAGDDRNDDDHDDERKMPANENGLKQEKSKDDKNNKDESNGEFFAIEVRMADGCYDQFYRGCRLDM